MPNRVREALGALWTSLWMRRTRLRADPERVQHHSPRADARARFWAEFREGQREADARARPR